MISAEWVHSTAGISPALSALTQNAQADQVQSPFHWDALNLSHATSVNPTPFLSPKFGNRSVTLAQNAAPCYSIRSYRFTREDPRSDSTKFVDYSTCHPGTEFHIKDAVNLQSR
jgi:hypothetical protein